jgi:pyruvate/2-oxoglutarate dehydrogenase complex dihydrolipoamide dehydrogenase (E3) component
MERDGVHFALDTNVRRAEHDGRTVRLVLDGAMPGRTLAGDRLLVAAGRRPNVEGLALDAAGIDVDRHGVIVDDRLRTSNSRVFASGDVCSKYKFTHAADAMSRVVLQNALFFGRRKASALTVPWCTYTFPELAHVGVTLEEAASGDLASLTVAFEDIDRAILDDDCEGFVRVHHRGGRLVGCTIVGAHAGDLIGLAAFAVARSATLADFSATIFPYPTVAEAFRKAGDAHQKTRLTPLIRRSLEMFLSLMR